MDIKIFREHPEVVKESQRNRFRPEEAVDEVIKLDKELREGWIPCSSIFLTFSQPTMLLPKPTLTSMPIKLN